MSFGLYSKAPGRLMIAGGLALLGVAAWLLFGDDIHYLIRSAAPGPLIFGAGLIRIGFRDIRNIGWHQRRVAAILQGMEEALTRYTKEKR